MSESKSIRQTIDTCNEARDYVETYTQDVEDLCGLVEELIVTNPAALLAPVLRRIIVEHARKVMDQNSNIRAYLCVDNDDSNRWKKGKK